MTISGLDNELKTIIENISYNWAKCEEVEQLPAIMQTALDGFRESIITYLENAE